jgi:hypothetical protein
MSTLRGLFLQEFFGGATLLRWLPSLGQTFNFPKLRSSIALVFLSHALLGGQGGIDPTDDVFLIIRRAHIRNHDGLYGAIDPIGYGIISNEFHFADS